MPRGVKHAIFRREKRKKKADKENDREVVDSVSAIWEVWWSALTQNRAPRSRTQGPDSGRSRKVSVPEKR